jgi:hypothetical protein
VGAQARRIGAVDPGRGHETGSAAGNSEVPTKAASWQGGGGRSVGRCRRSEGRRTKTLGEAGSSSGPAPSQPCSTNCGRGLRIVEGPHEGVQCDTGAFLGSRGRAKRQTDEAPAQARVTAARLAGDLEPDAAVGAVMSAVLPLRLGMSLRVQPRSPMAAWKGARWARKAKRRGDGRASVVKG